jgi:hypothetical protein
MKIVDKVLKNFYEKKQIKFSRHKPKKAFKGKGKVRSLLATKAGNFCNQI